MTAPVRRFYRIVKTDPPRLEDFLSNQARGITPPDTKSLTLWVWTCISVYATSAQAHRMARRYPRHGTLMAVLEIEPEAPVQVERTLSTPGHHTIWGDPTELLRRVVAVEPL